jgi:hypothetical protein
MVPCSCALFVHGGLTSASAQMQIIRAMVDNPAALPVPLLPICTPAQKLLLQSDDMIATGNQNVRSLQKSIQKCIINTDATLLRPYVSWDFPDGSIASQVLKGSLLSAEKLKIISQVLSKDLNIERAEAVITSVSKRVDARHQAAQEWIQDQTIDNAQRRGLPASTREVVERIKQDPETYERELRLLTSIVNPSKSTEILTSVLPYAAV